MCCGNSRGLTFILNEQNRLQVSDLLFYGFYWENLSALETARFQGSWILLCLCQGTTVTGTCHTGERWPLPLSHRHTGGCSCFLWSYALFLFPSFLWKSEAASASTRACVKICPDPSLPRGTAILCLASPPAPSQQGACRDKAEFLPHGRPALISASHFGIQQNTEDVSWKEGCCCCCCIP